MATSEIAKAITFHRTGFAKRQGRTDHVYYLSAQRGRDKQRTPGPLRMGSTRRPALSP